MGREYAAAALGVILILGAKEYVLQPAAAAQEAVGPAYLDPANWAASIPPRPTIGCGEKCGECCEKRRNSFIFNGGDFLGGNLRI
jgi:hypothetical protein